jgi:hypothetical protein
MWVWQPRRLGFAWLSDLRHFCIGVIYIHVCVCVCGGGSRGANLVEGTIWSMLANKSLKTLSALRLLFLGWNLSSKMSV